MERGDIFMKKEKKYDRTEFLKEISSLTRDEITKKMRNGVTRKKLIYPLLKSIPSQKNDS